MKDIWIICNVFRNIKKIKYSDFQAMTRRNFTFYVGTVNEPTSITQLGVLKM